MTSLAERFMQIINASLPIMRLGGSFRIGDGRIWEIYSQTISAVPTGKIVLRCDDTAELRPFVELATAAGYGIEEAGPPNTFIITLPNL